MEDSLVGSVTIWPLLDVLGWLHRERRSACIHIGSGMVIVWNGELVYAGFARLVGEQALLALCSLRRGFYTITAGLPRTFGCNVLRPTQEVLFHQLVATQQNSSQRNIA